jgi:hypothetical protein
MTLPGNNRQQFIDYFRRQGTRIVAIDHVGETVDPSSFKANEFLLTKTKIVQYSTSAFIVDSATVGGEEIAKWVDNYLEHELDSPKVQKLGRENAILRRAVLTHLDPMLAQNYLDEIEAK